MPKKEEKKYKVRYSVEPWNKEIEGQKGDLIIEGVRKSRTDYGYTDKLFLVSILNPGGDESILIMDNEDGIKPKAKTVEDIINYLEHYLEEHCD